MPPPKENRGYGPAEMTLIALYEALRSQRIPGDWPALTCLAGSFGSGLDVSAADVDKLRGLTVEEFAAVILAERRERQARRGAT